MRHSTQIVIVSAFTIIDVFPVIEVVIAAAWKNLPRSRQRISTKINAVTLRDECCWSHDLRLHLGLLTNAARLLFDLAAQIAIRSKDETYL